MPPRLNYDRGIHFVGTPLWFDSERPQRLCVVTSLNNRLPPPHERIVASTELAEALVRAGYEGLVLPTPRDRWVGVGGQNMQLFDLRVGLGFTAARVIVDDVEML